MVKSWKFYVLVSVYKVNCYGGGFEKTASEFGFFMGIGYILRSSCINIC